MSLRRAEMPGSDSSAGSGGNEALPEVTKLNRGLYALVFYILGASLLLLIAGWIVIAAIGQTVPEGIPVVVGAIVGGLTGVVAVNSKSDGQ